MIDTPLMNEIREAAAQGKTSLHDEKVCSRCNGYMLVPFGILSFKECPKCNGTGKENAK